MANFFYSDVGNPIFTLKVEKPDGGVCACGNLSAFQPFLTRDYEFESLGLHTSRAFIFIASIMALIIKLAFHNCSCFYKNTFFLTRASIKLLSL